MAQNSESVDAATLVDRPQHRYIYTHTYIHTYILLLCRLPVLTNDARRKTRQWTRPDNNIMFRLH